jgi:hypothetical protein
MAGLLGGVLPAIYSGADQLKRQVYGLLTNPQEQAQRAAQSLLQSRAERQALMARTFANPERPFQVTDQAGLSQLTDQVMSGELGFAPAGITAFHGSPYRFNKFDSSKIGSGEGAQAYGHGMYFAENPAVAEGYKKNTSFTKYIDKSTGELVDVTTLPKEKLADLSKNYIESKGSLYKVDIPDEQIPTMMDWDKPLSEQSDFVKKAINNLKKQVTPEMKDELGGNLNLLFGKDITPAQFLNTWEIIHPTGGTGIGEKLLNEQGVKGIRYLDNTSRNLVGGKPFIFKTQDGWIADISNDVQQGIGGFPLQTQTRSPIFSTKEEVEKWVETNTKTGTSNFVVFDPTDVKILERNNQPVEGLLD